MGAKMNGYYAYFIGKDGHFTNRVQIICNDDEEAKRFAKQLVDGSAIELWHEARMIATFEPNEDKMLACRDGYRTEQPIAKE
jgi:hypothetical protein